MKERDLSQVVVTFFEPQTCEPDRGLTSSSVFLGQLDRELVEDLAGVALEGGEERSVTVYHDEAERRVGVQEQPQVL